MQVKAEVSQSPIPANPPTLTHFTFLSAEEVAETSNVIVDQGHLDRVVRVTQQGHDLLLYGLLQRLEL